MRILKAFSICLIVMLSCAPWRCYSDERNLVSMTLVPNASEQGAVCLDGSSPAYHLDRGFGSGVNNWLLQFEGGGWCNDVDSCLARARSRRGSTRYMSKLEVFSGILSRNASQNPDFYNWNRVKLRYCDGASFAGDAMFYNQTTRLYFRGQKIWRAIILDLLPKGLDQADMALLSGCSAGGLATFFHCDNLATFLPKTATVKCLSDAGFFLDIRDITLNHTARDFYENLITLQGIGRYLNRNCTSARYYPNQCFFPQYALTYIKTPYFILNSAYDVYQFHHHLVPPSADLHGHWKGCKLNLASCTPTQIAVLQDQDPLAGLDVNAMIISPSLFFRLKRAREVTYDFRYDMLKALTFFYEFSRKGGMFINSCFSHCQSESQDTWLADDSPRVNDKTIAEAVGDWYFERTISKEVDCPYPCDSTCHNLVPYSEDYQ